MITKNDIYRDGIYESNHSDYDGMWVIYYPDEIISDSDLIDYCFGFGEVTVYNKETGEDATVSWDFFTENFTFVSIGD